LKTLEVNDRIATTQAIAMVPVKSERKEITSSDEK